MSENSTRTVYGAYLQTCQLMGLPFTLVPHTTLNEKLQIQQGATLGANEMPRMRYLAIGNGGHDVKTGGGGQVVPVPLQHEASDGAPFNMIPFVLRHVDDDLNATQRARYGLRRTESIGGQNYFAYYLRRIDMTTVVAKMNHKAVSGSNTVITDFVPDATNLSPTPPDLSNTGTNVASGDYLSATARLVLQLDAFDVAEIVNAVKVIYGDEDLALISEMALCSGVDRNISTQTTSNAAINFNEVVATQIHSHLKSIHLLRFTAGGIDQAYDVGATEPLFLV